MHFLFISRTPSKYVCISFHFKKSTKQIGVERMERLADESQGVELYVFETWAVQVLIAENIQLGNDVYAAANGSRTKEKPDRNHRESVRSAVSSAIAPFRPE